MDPRAVELSDITKFYPTEKSLKNTSVKRDDSLFISKKPFTIWQRKNDGTMEKFALLNTISVGEAGGDFTSIKQAVDSVTDNSTSRRYTIQVGPGTYIEDGPIQMKEFLTIEAVGIHSVIVRPLNSDTDIFIGAKFSHIIGLVLDGVIGVSSYAVRHNTPGELLLEDCVFRNCSNGVLLNNVNAGLELYNCAANTPIAITNDLVLVTNGSLFVDNLKIRIAATINTIISITGSSSFARLSDIQSLSTNVITGIFADNGCRVSGLGMHFAAMVDGIVVQGNNTQVRLDSNQILNVQNDGFRINNIGSDVVLVLFATTISNASGFNFNILNPDSVTSGNGFTEIDNVFMVSGAELYAYLLDTKEDDEGFNVIGELHVGLPERPVESSLGGGDSYTRGMLVYTKTEANVFNDVSLSARTASGSSYTYPGSIADNAIYVASSLSGDLGVLEHFGIKVKTLIAAVKGTGSIVIEYWNGSSWSEVEGMEVESSGRYLPHANNYFETIGSRHIRYNSQLAIDNWTKNDPIIPAIGTEYFWVRYRIVSDITTAPVFEQFKLHTNRSEINSDGWIEYFGKARPIGQLGLNFSASKPFEGNMQSQTLYINEDVGVGYTNNKFTLSSDKSGIAGFLPFDFDTSCPIVLEWSGMANTSQTIEWTVRAGWVTDNGIDEYFVSEPILSPGIKEVVVSKAILADKVSMFTALIDVKEMLSRRDGGFGDELWLSLQPSILSGTFAISSSQATYTKWCEGGHI